MRRPGNKSAVMPQLAKFFPKKFDVFMELFSGGLGATQYVIKHFAPKYVYINDMDKNVFNVWLQLRENKEELYRLISEFPYDKATYNFVKTATPQSDIERAAWFLVLNSWGFMSKPETLAYEPQSSKEMLLKQLLTDYNTIIKGCQINNCDYQQALKEWHFKHKTGIDRTFVYFDPPYIKSNQAAYDTPDWQLPELDNLMAVAKSYGFRFGISEFRSPEVERLAEKYGLNIYDVKIRQSNSVKEVTEVYICNYDVKQAKQQMIW